MIVSAFVVSAASLLIMALTGRRQGSDSDWRRLHERIAELEEDLKVCQAERRRREQENIQLMRQLVRLNGESRDAGR